MDPIPFEHDAIIQFPMESKFECIVKKFPSWTTRTVVVNEPCVPPLVIASLRSPGAVLQLAELEALSGGLYNVATLTVEK